MNLSTRLRRLEASLPEREIKPARLVDWLLSQRDHTLSTEEERSACANLAALVIDLGLRVWSSKERHGEPLDDEGHAEHARLTKTVLAEIDASLTEGRFSTVIEAVDDWVRRNPDPNPDGPEN